MRAAQPGHDDDDDSNDSEEEKGFTMGELHPSTSEPAALQDVREQLQAPEPLDHDHYMPKFSGNPLTKLGGGASGFKALR